MLNTIVLMPVRGEATQTVEVEVLSEAQHRSEVKERVAQEILQQDRFARDRAFRLLKRCQAGSIPNLLQDANLMHFDAILASKVVVRLLQLNFVVHGRYRMPNKPSSYLLPGNAELVLSCGNMLFELGGIALMEYVIDQWIPALDQGELRQAWRPIGL